MADEWEIEMERWAEKHPEEDRELCRMGNPDFIAAGVADRENMCYDLVFDTFKKKKALQPLKTRACSALWSVHEI